MISAIEIRDFWEAELFEEAERLNEPEPEPWAELAYMRWHFARSAIPVIEVDPKRTWVWSDLHLNEEALIITGQRPYRSTTAMNRALLAAWQTTVKDQDTIICLGDVAHPNFWMGPAPFSRSEGLSRTTDPRHGQPRRKPDQGAGPGRIYRTLLGGDTRHRPPRPRSRTFRSVDGPCPRSTSTGTCTAKKTEPLDTQM